METLSALQDKIERLLSLVKDLKADKAELEKSNKQLVKKLESLESAANNNEQDVKDLSEEKARTRMVVEDLIKSIDSFIHEEKQ